MLGERNAALDPVHPNRVLLVFENFVEYSEQLGLRDSWNHLYHLVEHQSGLLPYLCAVILGSDLIKNLQKLLLIFL